MNDDKQVQTQPTTIKKQVVINKSGTGIAGNAIYVAVGAVITAVAQYFGYDITEILSVIGLG